MHLVWLEMKGKGCSVEVCLNVWEVEWGPVLLDEGVFLCPCLGICRCTVKENCGELVVVVVGKPPSDG